MSSVRGIRGAITVESNSAEGIVFATEELLKKIQADNAINIEDIISVIFSVTKDLNAEFPAVAARNIGWNTVPLLCTEEIPVPNSLPLCIRVLMHVNTEKKQTAMKSVYLKGATVLRPDQQGDQQ